MNGENPAFCPFELWLHVETEGLSALGSGKQFIEVRFDVPRVNRLRFLKEDCLTNTVLGKWRHPLSLRSPSTVVSR